MGIRVVEEWGADILHLHTAMLWHVASAIQAITGKPLVYHVHSVDRAEYYLVHRFRGAYHICEILFGSDAV